MPKPSLFLPVRFRRAIPVGLQRLLEADDDRGMWKMLERRGPATVDPNQIPLDGKFDVYQGSWTDSLLTRGWVCGPNEAQVLASVQG